MNLTDWGKRVGLNPPTIRRRLKLGWSIERALTENAAEQWVRERAREAR